jgi:hypothetical protein
MIKILSLVCTHGEGNGLATIGIFCHVKLGYILTYSTGSPDIHSDKNNSINRLFLIIYGRNINRRV